MQATQSDRALNRIIQGLAQKPVYLFFFGICFLAFGGGGAAAAVGTLENKSGISTAGMAVVGLSLICAVIVVYLAEKEGKGVPTGKIGDTDFDPVLEDISSNIRSALSRAHPVFHQKMIQECSEFQARTALWSKGQLSVSHRDYNQLLRRVYENATKKVFATSTLDFLPAWADLLGKDILAAHKHGKAPVRRVFVFDNLTSIPVDAVEEMKKQKLAGIEVRVYGIQEDVSWEIPDNTPLGFAIIDEGDVIALTNPGVGKSFSGTFFFKEKGFTERYKNIAGELDRGSRSFEEFIRDSDPTWKPDTAVNSEGASN